MDGDLSGFSMTFASRPQSRDERVAFCVLFIVGLACITLPFFWSQKFASGVGTEMIVVGSVFCLLSAGLHASVRYQLRGMWWIDPEGIAYESESGKSQTMRWKEVEYVSWLHPEAGLRLISDRHRIVVPLRLIDESVRDEVIARLQAVLGSDFDLTRRVVQRSFADVEPRWLGGLLYWGRLVLLGVAIACVMLIPVWLIDRFHLWLNPWPFRIVGLSWMASILGASIWGLFYQERRNPTWRKRIAKLPLPDDWQAW